MSQRAKEISARIKSFSDNVMAFVENLSDDDWRKVCKSEEWPVGATAYHLGAGHFAIFDMAGMIVRGEDLPPLTMDQINAMSDKQAREHADCTKAEAIEALQKNSVEMVAFVAGLTDDELDRKGSMPAFGGEATTEQLIQFVIFESATRHFDSMKTAVGK
ncbi:MAG: DinB family protein [Desulfobacterales bacterium]